jgi:hypothetical protein
LTTFLPPLVPPPLPNSVSFIPAIRFLALTDDPKALRLRHAHRDEMIEDSQNLSPVTQRIGRGAGPA